ncbi:hypothetical protein V8E54_008812 [Elaphomyces granulatus]
MGRRMNTVVWSHFTTLMAPDGNTCKEVKCRHCDWKAAQNTCRMAQHLEKCVVYLQSRGIAEEKKRLDELDEREALELESTLLEAPLDDADTGETGDGETAGGLAETSSKRRRPGEY